MAAEEHEGHERLHGEREPEDGTGRLLDVAVHVAGEVSVHGDHVGHRRVEREADRGGEEDDRDVEQVPCERDGAGDVLLADDGGALALPRGPALGPLDDHDPLPERKHERKRHDGGDEKRRAYERDPQAARRAVGHAAQRTARLLRPLHDEQAGDGRNSGRCDRHGNHDGRIAPLEGDEARIGLRGGRHGDREALVAAREIGHEREQKPADEGREGEHADGGDGGHGNHSSPARSADWLAGRSPAGSMAP